MSRFLFIYNMNHMNVCCLIFSYYDTVQASTCTSKIYALYRNITANIYGWGKALK